MAEKFDDKPREFIMMRTDRFAGARKEEQPQDDAEAKEEEKEA